MRIQQPDNQNSEPSEQPEAALTDHDRLMTFQEGCDFLKMSRRWVAQHLNEIPHLRLGRNIRFRLSALIEWCKSLEKGGEQ